MAEFTTARPADRLRRHSPLEYGVSLLAGLPGSIRVIELPFLTQVNLRLDPGGAAADRVAAVLDVALPTTPCTSMRSGTYEVLWMGPDEWLVLAPDGAAEFLTAALAEAIGTDVHGAVTDVSAQRFAVSLSGPSSREVLAKGCSIDLHPAAAPRGTCVQTLLSQIGLVVVAHDDAGTDFLLLVRSSFAQYFVDWLVDATVELS